MSEPRSTRPSRELRPARPVARLSSPAEVVASLPVTLGFRPTESLVVVCCHEPRGRMGLCLRFDLPAHHDATGLVREVGTRVRHEGATRVVLAVYTGSPDDPTGSGAGRVLPHRGLVDAVREELRGVVVTEAALIRDDRFWSYLCGSTACCPADGTPVERGQDSPAVQLLQAESVLRGQAVLPDRAAVTASIAAPALPEAAAALDRLATCEALLCEAMLEDLVDARRASLGAWDEVLVRFCSPPGRLGDLEAAALAVALSDVLVRDAVCTRWVRAPQALAELLAELCRRTPAPYDVPAATLLAWVTYAGGAGALVGVALERALSTDPTYPLARLLEDALTRQVPPETIRGILRTVSTLL